MPLRISVYTSRELMAVIARMKTLDRDVRKQIRQETKAIIDPEWRRAVAEQASTPLEQRVLAQTARIAVSDQNVTLKSASVGRRLSGGLLPSESYYAAEFGAAQDQYRKYETTSRSGHRYAVRRRTTNQLRPRKKSGYVVYPAAANIIPRLAALWTQTWVRGFHEAAGS